MKIKQINQHTHAYTRTVNTQAQIRMCTHTETHILVKLQTQYCCITYALHFQRPLKKWLICFVRYSYILPKLLTPLTLVKC